MTAQITGTTRVACVLGSPVRHSLSPAIHNAAFAAAGVDAVYVALDVDAADLGRTVTALRAVGFEGASVTMPLKEAALSLCDTVGPVARALGSVNTLVPRSDGTLHGESTDGEGCVGALRGSGVDPLGRRCIVVGAGATARACILALAESGAAAVGVLNRTPSRAADAARLAAGVGYVAQSSDIENSDVIVHTTPAGMGDNVDTAFDYGQIREHHTVLDAVYQPLETPLLATARLAGARCSDGLWMLVHQAVAQQDLWTGSRPDPAIMRAAAERELERRRG